MGTKNRIYLGLLIDLILHNIRNKFDKKELYITKTKQNKIKIDHAPEYKYLNNQDFQQFLDNTVGYCLYQKQKNIYNFVSFVNEKYYIYSISTNNHYLEMGTFFRASAKRLKRCIKEDIKFFNERHNKKFDEYLNIN